MVSRREALVNLTAILRRAPGAEDEVVEEGLLEVGEALVSDALEVVGPISWSLDVQRTGGDEDDFFLQGSADGVVRMECRRCLKPVEVPVHAEFLYPMAYRPAQEAELELSEAEDEDDLLTFGTPVIDFAPLLLQMLAIEVPLTALCRPDCRGLSLDGVDLNLHPEHAEPAGDVTTPRPSPFAALADLAEDDEREAKG
jgi:uncharacterized protein